MAFYYFLSKNHDLLDRLAQFFGRSKSRASRGDRVRIAASDAGSTNTRFLTQIV